MKPIGPFISARMVAGVFALALVSSHGVGLAAGPGAGGEAALVARYAELKPKLEKNQFGAPIFLESEEKEGYVQVDMYGVVNFPFDLVRDSLDSPASWCEIAPLHINVKACTFKTSTQPDQLTLYSGRKYYQPPSDAYPIRYRFRVVSREPGFLDLSLDADEGPLGTKDHRIVVQAAPLDPQRSILRFSYTYSHGAMARMAIRGYFSTIGKGKVGFTVVGTKGGRPRYIEGVRGAVERNTMRYYLALQTFLETQKVPQSQVFEQRISRWYDLTARYGKQLKEIDKNGYLANKRMERARQMELQAKEGN